MASGGDKATEAWQRLHAGSFEEAERIAREILQAESHRADAWLLVGVACKMQGKLDDAAAAYEQAVDFYPLEALINLAAVYVDQGHFSQAEHCARQAVQLNPGSVVALFNLGTALGWQRKYDDAVACFALCSA